MKNSISLLALLILTISVVYGQEVAVTTSGDTVYLFDNGTWSYDSEMEFIDDETDFLSAYVVQDSTNTVYNVPAVNKKVIDNGENSFVLNFNNKLWKRVPAGQINEDAQYCFVTKDEGLYGMVINEEVEIGLLPIFNIAMENVREATGADPKVLSSDYVMVNGKQMIKAEYQVVAGGMDMTLNSLYYSDENGTTQYTTWSFSNIYKKKKKVMDELLSGLVIR